MARLPNPSHSAAAFDVCAAHAGLVCVSRRFNRRCCPERRARTLAQLRQFLPRAALKGGGAVAMGWEDVP